MKIIMSFLACFIPNRKLRHKLRNIKIVRTKDKLIFIENFLKRTTDITKLPKAYGVLRTLQLGNLKLFDLVHQICVKNKLKYWMHYGTLLGAVRHGGFVPWDDDIDICMMREDYEKLMQILSSDKYVSSGINFKVGPFLKIYYKQSVLSIDVFPMDRYHKKIESKREFKYLRKRINKACRKFRISWRRYSIFGIRLPIANASYSKIRKIDNKTVMENKLPAKDGTVYIGLECASSDTVLYDYNHIFPVKTMKFEGKSFMAPNRSDLLLYLNFNDYYEFPEDIYPKHGLLPGLNIDKIMEIEKFLAEDNSKILKKLF